MDGCREGVDMLKTPRNRLCIDIDYEDEDSSFRILKALYMFSWVKREVWETRHGLHIYLDISYDRDLLPLRALLGDDLRRLEYDELYQSIGYWINKCFTSSEVLRLL